MKYKVGRYQASNIIAFGSFRNSVPVGAPHLAGDFNKSWRGGGVEGKGEGESGSRVAWVASSLRMTDAYLLAVRGTI